MIEAPAIGPSAAAPAAGMNAQSRPRVSASSFKDLTARLRKSDIPSLSPVAVPREAAPIPVQSIEAAPQPKQVEPEIRPVQVSFETAAEATLAPQWPSTPHVEELAPALELAPAPEFGQAKTVMRERPLVESPELAPLSEVELTPQPVSRQEVSTAPALDPVLDRPLGLEPALESSFAPSAQPAPSVELETADVLLPIEPVAESVQPVAAPEAKEEPLSTAELVPTEDAANAALVEMAKDRQHQLELEIIWRMLLATPSTEDRNTYLREAEEIMGPQLQPLPEAPPEHDLSRIAPAAEVELSADMALQSSNEPLEPAVLLPADDPALADNAELARSLLDMMASGTSSGLPQERALAADTLLRLVPRLDTKTLVMLSQRVARMDNPPQMMVARLLRHSDVEVSGPLLEDCSQITDKDLESVVAEQDPARMRMIARRRSLGHAITDALVASGDPSVLLTLVRNAEAEISQEGFLKLIAAAGSNIDLLAPLCTRSDMSAPMAFELFWHAPAQLRRFVLSRFLTDSETLTKILRITMSTNELEQLPEQQETSLQHTVVEALERAARGKLEVAADELASVLKVDKKTALRILKDKQGEPLVVMLKVAGYPRQALPGLLNRFRDPEVGLLDAEREADELVAIFETLSFNKARILLTYWDWSQRRTGPYAPLQ